MMSRILITGASGFIGSHLTEFLVRRGDRVRCLVRRSSQLSSLESLDVEFAWGDVTDADSVAAAVDGVDVVFHVAGLTHVCRRHQFWEVNQQGTGTVARACARRQTPPVHVYVSSIAAGGPATPGQERSESDPPAPVSDYGRSKLAGEQSATQFAAEVPTTIIRPGIVFGPRDRLCLPIYETIDRLGIHPVPGYRSAPLSFIHVHDLVPLLVTAAEHGTRLPSDGPRAEELERGCYHATVEEHPSYADFGRLIARALGRSRPLVVPIPIRPLFVVAGANELIARLRGRADSFNRDKMREARVASWAVAANRAQRELGFQPSMPLEAHLRGTVGWYREHGWLPRRKVSGASTVTS